MIPAIGGLHPSLNGLPGLAGWWPFHDSTKRTIATGVSQLNDISGNARHLAQATGTLQPAVSGTLNGRTGVSFDGSDDRMLWNGSLDNTGGHTFMAVMRADATDSRIPWVMSRAGADGWCFLETRATPSYRAGVNDGAGAAVTGSSFSPATAHTMIMTYDDASGALEILANGVSVLSGTTRPTALNPYTDISFGAWGATVAGGPRDYSVCTHWDAALVIGAPSALTTSRLNAYARQMWRTH